MSRWKIIGTRIASESCFQIAPMIVNEPHKQTVSLITSEPPEFDSTVGNE